MTERDSIAVLGWQIGLLVAVALVWQGLAIAGLINPATLGTPLGILTQAVGAVASGDIWPHVRITLLEQVAGFAIGVGLGTFAAWGLWWTPRLRAALDPLVALFNGIPKIALAPPMIVWFGIFATSKIALSAVVCLTVAWMAAAEGIRRTDADRIDMMRAMGASRWHVFRKVVVPSSMPAIISAAKINVGFALVGAVVAEFVASNQGLGYLAVQASIFFQIDRLWMVVLLISIIAALQYFIVLEIERRLLHWSVDVRGT